MLSGRSFGLLLLSCTLPSAAAFASTVPDPVEPPTIAALCADLVSWAHDKCTTTPGTSTVQECAQALGTFDTNADATLDTAEIQKAVEGFDQDTDAAAESLDDQACIHSQVTSLLANADSGERQLSDRPSNRQLLDYDPVDYYSVLMANWYKTCLMNVMLGYALSMDLRYCVEYSCRQGSCTLVQGNGLKYYPGSTTRLYPLQYAHYHDKSSCEAACYCPGGPRCS